MSVWRISVCSLFIFSPKLKVGHHSGHLFRNCFESRFLHILFSPRKEAPSCVLCEKPLLVTYVKGHDSTDRVENYLARFELIGIVD